MKSSFQNKRTATESKAQSGKPIFHWQAARHHRRQSRANEDGVGIREHIRSMYRNAWGLDVLVLLRFIAVHGFADVLAVHFQGLRTRREPTRDSRVSRGSD